MYGVIVNVGSIEGKPVKKMTFVLLFTMVLTAAASASIKAGHAPVSLILPQPATFFLCTAGMAVLRFLGCHVSKRIP